MSDRPAILLVGTANEFTARKILGTDQKLGTNFNDINVTRQEGLRLVVWDKLDDSPVTRNAWFLLPDPAKHKMFKFEPDTLDHKMWDEQARDVTIHRAKYMLAFDFWDYRNIVASYAP